MTIILNKALFEKNKQTRNTVRALTHPNDGGFPPFLSAHGADVFVKQHPLKLEQKGGRTKTVQSCTQPEIILGSVY